MDVCCGLWCTVGIFSKIQLGKNLLQNREKFPATEYLIQDSINQKFEKNRRKI